MCNPPGFRQPTPSRAATSGVSWGIMSIPEGFQECFRWSEEVSRALVPLAFHRTPEDLKDLQGHFSDVSGVFHGGFIDDRKDSWAVQERSIDVPRGFKGFQGSSWKLHRDSGAFQRCFRRFQD